MAISEKILKAPPSAGGGMIPSDHFGTVLYTGNAGSTHSINGGKLGAAAIFNGSNAKITANGKPLNGSPSITISFWARNISVSTWQGLMGESGDSSKAGYRILVHQNDDGQMSLARSSGANSYIISDSYFYDFGTDGSTWVHCAFTASSTEMKYYKNGTNVLTQSVSNSATTGSEYNFTMMFGEQYSRYTEGDLDQVRLYTDTLTPTEITALYEETLADSWKVNFPTGKTAKALYRLNGNANDETGVYDGTASNITWKYGVNFTPDLVWIKRRDSGIGDTNHLLFDSIRGANKRLMPNVNNTESTETDELMSFDSGGFTVGADASINGSGGSIAAWCWNAGGSSVTNDDGSETTTVRANQDAGFSIVTWTGGSSSIATTGHGLSSAPEFIILKQRNLAGHWYVYHKDLTSENSLRLDTNAEESTAVSWTVDSEIFHTDWTNTIYNWVAYCFHSVPEYSKIGSYTGNGNDHGPMVETGFEPAFLMIKKVSGDPSYGGWHMWDNKRNTTNPRNSAFEANDAYDEETADSRKFNFYSDGFQPITDADEFNDDSSPYIYIAIAAPPETTTPVVADSFNITAYAGTSADQDITMNFGGAKPDFVWIKNRDATYNHALYDSVRGAEKPLSSNTNAAEDSDIGDTYGLKSFNTDGFGLGNTGAMTNTNGNDFISYGWKAGGDAEILTGSGSNNDVIASVNDDAGFSILKYEGTGSSGMKIRHGLSATPAMVMVKKLDANPAGWLVWFDQGLTDFDYWLYLNTNGGQVDSIGTGFSAAPDANLLTFGTSGIGNDANLRYVAYSWRRVSGYSGFGTYTGNGGTNAITINDGGSGFQPDFVLAKPIGTGSWLMMDSVRGANKQVYADLYSDEYSDSGNSFHSTGFTMKSNGNWNNDTVVYTYAAFKIN